ncbi:hypothetical protein [Humibacter albus]|uniref:hypothetical protein n=1 Tax=Humibacter albus TaxID=427754 RepID=UPI00040C25F4
MEYCIFVEPQLGATWDQLLAIAQATDRAGFHGFFRSDHYIGPDRESSAIVPSRMPGPLSPRWPWPPSMCGSARW